MEELKRSAALRLPALPKLKRTSMLEDAVAFAVLGGGGYLALRLAGLIFRALGVD